MKRLIVACLLAATPAMAQQQPPSPNEQALSAKLLQELQISLSCSSGAITLQTELAKAQARIKEMEAAAAK